MPLFSQAGALEGQFVIQQQRNLTPVSVQNILDCTLIANEGCLGGFPAYGMAYVQTSGIATNTSYPYNSPPAVT